jgi:hypothetical protein
MRAARLGLVLSAALAFLPGARAQDLPLTALPFLEISPSPSANAIGGAGVALAEADPYGFLYNPARLGLAARDARAFTALYPGGSTDWLAFGDLQVGSAALGAGFDLTAGGLPLTAGVGLGHTALRFGERVAVDDEGTPLGAYEPVDRYYALSVGAATTGAARVGLGLTGRLVTSTDRVVVSDDGVATTNIWGFTFDVGLLAEADVARLLGRPRLGPVRPAASVSAGYAQKNIGGEVGYSGFPQAPLPRTAFLGWSARAGLDLPTKAGGLRLVEGEVAVQAEHSLVRPANAPGYYNYQLFIGSLDPLENGFLGEGNAVVTGRRGWRVSLAETVTYSRGGFDGWGFDHVRTHGLGVRLAGPLKAAALLSGSDALADLAGRFDLRLTHAVVFSGDVHESAFDGLTLVVGR